MTVLPLYVEQLNGFLKQIAPAAAAPSAPAIYHAIRNIPYASTGSRTPERVLAERRGACTAKHILLRDLLRRAGYVADVAIVEGDFAAGMPVVETMPEPLKRSIRTAGVRDFHNFVVWQSPHGVLKLDATWPDALRQFGYPVNYSWSGEGDTALALKPWAPAQTIENVIDEKASLLAKLSAEETAKRLAFLALLTEWLSQSVFRT